MKPQDDPIVTEARKAGEELFKQFNNDLSAVFAHLRQRTNEAQRQGRTVVSLPPCLIKPALEPAKQAG